MKHGLLLSYFYICSLLAYCLFAAGCSTDPDTANADVPPGPAASNSELSANRPDTERPKTAALIEIKPNSPADTVKTFYERLRDKKVREALHLTNLRPAIEKLTDDELNEFAVDFEAVAKRVPRQIKINGEIINDKTGSATVTALLPNDEGVEELQKVELVKENEHWVIVAADKEAEAQIKKHGKDYFRLLKVETGHEEAKKMLERLSKAQIVYAAQSGGVYGEIPALINSGFLPSDITTSATTGYDYVLVLSDDKKNYHATATPAKYGVTGKLSFRMVPTEKGLARVSSGDNRGKPLANMN